MVRRAERLCPEHSAHADVVDVLRAAGDVCDAVVTRKSRAYGLHAGLPGINTSSLLRFEGRLDLLGVDVTPRGGLDRLHDLDVPGAAADVT